MKPLDVKDPKFPVEQVIYDDDKFSIIWGPWNNDGVNGLGMRWNRLPREPGFPLASGKPAWLVIPLDLSLPFLTALLGKRHTNNVAVLQAIQELEANGALSSGIASNSATTP